MKPIVLAGTILLGLAAQAEANSQLAQGMNITPGAYSTAELVQLRAAQDDGNAALFAHLMQEFGDSGSTVRNGPSGGEIQMARTIGVEPGTYSAVELQQLRGAMEDGDTARVAFITNDAGTSDAPGSTAGQQQLAEFLAVDADDYTRAELVQMYIGVIQ